MLDIKNEYSTKKNSWSLVVQSYIALGGTWVGIREHSRGSPLLKKMRAFEWYIRLREAAKKGIKNQEGRLVAECDRSMMSEGDSIASWLNDLYNQQPGHLSGEERIDRVEGAMKSICHRFQNLDLNVPANRAQLQAEYYQLFPRDPDAQSVAREDKKEAKQQQSSGVSAAPSLSPALSGDMLPPAPALSQTSAASSSSHLTSSSSPASSIAIVGAIPQPRAATPTKPDEEQPDLLSKEDDLELGLSQKEGADASQAAYHS